MHEEGRKSLKKRARHKLGKFRIWLESASEMPRLLKPTTKLFGPLYKRSNKSIEVDITYICSLRCFNCNRSCRQAPSSDQMTVQQIKKFVKESINNNVKWERIRLLGGEPTLHPDLYEILRLIIEYKRDFSPNTTVQLTTNCFGTKVNRVITEIKNQFKEVNIVTSPKTPEATSFSPFNLAPKDSILYKYADYSNGCGVIENCGMGLTPYGYYPCAVAGGIDRVFGFDYGKKKLPRLDDPMIDQLNVFCKLCGHFRRGTLDTTKELMSPTWKKAYEDYKTKKPKLSLY